jgi:hypothetical protein
MVIADADHRTTGSNGARALHPLFKMVDDSEKRAGQDPVS